ncbi:YecA family protein [Aliidiomarina minuta]|uniref:YecA family protein n=1 Tax=Aliidiomarina minuta TaxID=880057 RepID=A0A432W4M5_9GAMM|nr:UPF0149 family protein [Aliidiomarina minuta]RUO24436.1 YecA family protein [Aliidiomarina minuta]
MTESTARAYDALNQHLQREDMVLCAAELHGMLTGLIASGAPAESEKWHDVMADLANEGNAFSVGMKSLLRDLSAEIISELEDPELGFQLLLPGDEEALNERLKALTQWVQSFLAGFGVNQQNLAKASADLQEAINDMAEIALLSDDVEADEEGERAFYEVSEYVRISSIMCFNELGQLKSAAAPHNKTIH